MTVLNFARGFVVKSPTGRILHQTSSVRALIQTDMNQHQRRGGNINLATVDWMSGEFYRAICAQEANKDSYVYLGTAIELVTDVYYDLTSDPQFGMEEWKNGIMISVWN